MVSLRFRLNDAAESDSSPASEYFRSSKGSMSSVQCVDLSPERDEYLTLLSFESSSIRPWTDTDTLTGVVKRQASTRGLKDRHLAASLSIKVRDQCRLDHRSL